MSTLTFRDATEDDVALILEFIRKLADYEHRLDEVIATEDELRKWIFDKKQAEVIFALEDGKEIGFALFFLSFSTYISNVNLHLEDLFIDPEYRGRGYGKALLKKLAKIVVDRGYGRFEWTCLAWNKPSIDFYLSLGAKQKDWNVFHLTGDELRDLAND
ncbi:MAG: GNAT family N-acetyltransferase [Methanobrevibacter sp.]|uniref:GNAT family N-acetyltransferase n=1 Tax=Methanobrevibacter sp. TaxID=66852 RepID=UPI00257CDCAD|nr:GNAT family N-acetyltransferase [Methanobrevibacter sp.]MBR2664923.1 GNAT family N-acetyltransferase [Methanobrevibacter sp.]MBR3198300.1 GNAT family N-acetyltransferase [Methanobrevibacter sp.]MBR7051323.1 GNAT family N-acetyltransferase [Methanobrevibacter sp.]